MSVAKVVMQNTIEDQITTIAEGDEGCNTTEDSGNKLNTSLITGTSKSISLVKVTDTKEITEPIAPNPAVSDQKILDDSVTKGTKKDRKGTMECLNLETKPRFQRMAADTFRTFLTPKSMALELEKVELKPETSEILVTKYHMLQGPAVPYRGSSPVIMPRSASKGSVYPPKRPEPMTVDEKLNKVEQRAKSPKSVSETEQSESGKVIGGTMDEKHIKRKRRFSNKRTQEKEIEQLVPRKTDRNTNSGPYETENSETPKEKGMLVEEKIKKSTINKAHKPSQTKKRTKARLKKVASDENVSSFGTEKNKSESKEELVTDENLGNMDNTEWSIENKIEGGEKTGVENSTLNIFSGTPINFETRVNAVEGIEYVQETNTDSGSELTEADQVHLALKFNKHRPHTTVNEDDLSVSWSFLNRTKDRIFRDFMRTETLVKNEEEEPRRSYFFSPSMTIVAEDAPKLCTADFPDSSPESKDGSSKELLPAMSTNTVRLLSSYEANAVPKEHGKSGKASPEEINFEQIERTNTNNLAAFTELLATLKGEMEAGETGKSGQRQDSPCTEGEKKSGDKFNFLPNDYTDDEFKAYFCKDWINPEKPTTPEKREEIDQEGCTKTSIVEDGESNHNEKSRISEILDLIDDDEIYDLIFTYRLPKKAPFDLNDTVNEARFKCIFKWLQETGNAMYKTAFEEEVRAKSDEKVIGQLVNKMVSLQKKIKRCDVCNKSLTCPLDVKSGTSSSTFSDTEGCVEHESFPVVEAPTNSMVEDVTDPSDANIKCEIESLMRDLRQSIASYEDGEVLEKSALEMGVNDEEGKHDNGGQEPISTRVVLETRGTRRRREIRGQLEKLIELMENKLKRMKTRQIFVYKGEDEEGELLTFEKELSFKSCHCQDDDGKEDRSSPLPVNPLDAILRTFPVNFGRFLQKRSDCQKTMIPPSTEERSPLYLSKRNRMQLYLIDYLDTWETPMPDEDQPPNKDVKEKRLIEIINGNEYVKMGGQSVPLEEIISEAEETSGVELTEKKGLTQKKRESIDEPNWPKIPFTCSCFCDRVSRFNSKKKQHFRTVLNDHFWCLRTDPRLLDDEYRAENPSAMVPENLSLCPPQLLGQSVASGDSNGGHDVQQVVEEPDNFQGWLADSDRNLLLLMSRPPLDRIDKHYYKKNKPEKKMQLPLHGEVDEEHIAKKKKLGKLISKLSKAQAKRFCETVGRWYEDYKRRDKVRQMLELCEKVDLNAMLHRDLTMMRDAFAKQLEEAEKEVRIRVEEEKKEKFENDVKKLRAAYSCRLKNRLESKEKEMDSKKAFLVRCMLVEMKENFAPVIEKYKKRCIDWIETLRDKQNATSMMVTQRNVRELALIADKRDVAERVRRKLLGATGKEHEEVEKVLGKAIESRDIAIEGLKSDIVNLTRDFNIWRRAVGEVFKSFKKFVNYMLETRPDRAQYVLNLEKLYQLQMDDLIRDANNELEKDETNEMEPTGRPGDTLQPTMEIKCPSHDIRYASEHSGKTGSSGDTDIDKDIRVRKVVDHAVDAAIRTVLPTPEPSDGMEEEEDEDDLKELEQLIALWEQNSQELKIQSVSSEEICEDEVAEHERLVRVIGEGASDPSISVEEFTKRRIREMLEIIARKKPLIRSHVHL